MVKHMRVAVCGVGPRGLTVLERLVSVARRRADVSIQVHLVDPSEPAMGVHSSDLPEFILLNTVAGLPTYFPQRSHECDAKGMTFLEWLKSVNGGDGLGNSGLAMMSSPAAHCYFPRAVFGAYSRYAFREIVNQCPKNVRVVCHKTTAVEIRATGSVEVVSCSNGDEINADFVVLCLGHAENRPREGLKGTASYPFIRHVLQGKNMSGRRVAIAGFGLSAFDVLGTLTVGQGGRFQRNACEKLCYIASGREPSIFMFSRSGRPACARPQGDRGLFEYSPLVCHPATIKRLRSEQTDDGKLNFERQVLPIIDLELRAAHYRWSAFSSGKPLSEDAWAGLQSDEVGSVAEWIQFVSRGNGQVTHRYFGSRHAGPLSPLNTYSDEFRLSLQRDLAQAKRGINGSVEKYLSEVLLSLREALREAADFGGLDDESHDYFYMHFANSLRRHSIGPQPERCEELIALIEAGVVNTPFGPDPLVTRTCSGDYEVRSREAATGISVFVSEIVLAQTEVPSVDRSGAPLIVSLRRAGRLMPHRNDVSFEGGAAVSANLHPIDASGVQQRRLFVLGPICEGSTYYNTYVPTIRETVEVRGPLRDASIVASVIFPEVEGAPWDKE